MGKNLNVFKGQDSVKDYLNPDKLPNMPLVEIPKSLNPFFDEGVRIFAKLMTYIGLHHVKAVPAYNMMLEKFNRGELEGVTNVIENSSGNTISAIAVAARLFGIENIRAIVPDEVSWHKLQMLLFYGISPIVNKEPQQPDPTDPRSGVYKARAMGQQPGWTNPGQYHNLDNPKAHEKWIGKQIWKQTEGEISVFCASLGTTGTIIGNSTYLKSQNEAVQVVGVMRAPDNYVPGPRTEFLLRLISFDWRAHVDYIQEAETAESYQKSMELSRSGIVAGPSSGLALVGLLKFLQKQKEEGALAELRNDSGEIVSVFICPDTPIPYFDEYFKYLDMSNFPQITNEELLQNKPE
ncbi:MAG: pyridoxal-phosphate dependent enzyme [Chloroflexi bacterium]|nr:pyridoxal-phosphate dependent enzyme [Chloroflexota bacterium]